MIFLKWAFLNLYRNKRRSLATGLALIFGFTGMLLLSGYIVAVERFVRTQMIYLNHVGHFSVLKKGAVANVYRNPEKYLLSKEDQKVVLAELKNYETKIENVAPILSSFALLSSGEKNLPLFVQSFPKGFSSYVLDHRELKKWLPTYQERVKSSDGVSLTPNLYLMLGEAFPLAKKTEVQIVGKTIDGYINGVSEELTGQHTTGFFFAEDISAKMSIEKLQELMATDKINSFAVFLNDISDTESMIKTLRKALPADKYEVFGYNTDEIGFYYTGTMSFISSIGIFFYILITIASILSIINTLTMSINERTKEIGTLRSIGFTNSNVSSLFTFEILVLSFFSVLISTFLYYLVATVINSLKIPFEPAGSSGSVDFTLYVSLQIAVIHAILLMVITYITSYLSCKSKMKFNIAELLNEQGVFK